MQAMGLKQLPAFEKKHVEGQSTNSSFSSKSTEYFTQWVIPQYWRQGRIFHNQFSALHQNTFLNYLKIIEWLEFQGMSKGHLVPTPCHWQGCHPLHRTAQNSWSLNFNTSKEGRCGGGGREGRRKKRVPLSKLLSAESMTSFFSCLLGTS